ncbi:hypothetical protein FS749_010300 [Ceratobasidium sp. UAMH 11750]|nr:hypothetical protein FS749_010300 [Ceratobasidium sp. UAMH 11750]
MFIPAFTPSSNAEQEGAHPAAADPVAGSSLLRGFIHGAASYKPKAILIGNDYPGMSWDEASYRDGKCDFELVAAGFDYKRMRTWVGSLPSKPSVLVKVGADTPTIKSILRSYHTVPTLLYLNGHGEIRNEHVYYPADCSPSGCFWPVLGIPLTDMGKWLMEKVGPMKLTQKRWMGYGSGGKPVRIRIRVDGVTSVYCILRPRVEMSSLMRCRAWADFIQLNSVVLVHAMK